MQCRQCALVSNAIELPGSMLYDAQHVGCLNFRLGHKDGKIFIVLREDSFPVQARN